MSPLEIQILMHYSYTLGEDYSGHDGPSIPRAILRILENMSKVDLLEDDRRPDSDTIFKITSRGKFHVKALKNLPLPARQWVTPEVTETHG